MIQEWKSHLLSQANKEVLIKSNSPNNTYVCYKSINSQRNYVTSITLYVAIFGGDSEERRIRFMG